MDGYWRETTAHWELLRLLNNATDSTNREPELQPRKYGLVEPFFGFMSGNKYCATLHQAARFESSSSFKHPSTKETKSLS